MKLDAIFSVSKYEHITPCKMIIFLFGVKHESILALSIIFILHSTGSWNRHRGGCPCVGQLLHECQGWKETRGRGGGRGGWGFNSLNLKNKM